MSLIDSILKIILFNNNIKNSQYPKILEGILILKDLKNVFIVVEANYSINIDVSLNYIVNNLV